jgi:hypothetical protein
MMQGQKSWDVKNVVAKTTDENKYFIYKLLYFDVECSSTIVTLAITITAD